MFNDFFFNLENLRVLIYTIIYYALVSFLLTLYEIRLKYFTQVSDKSYNAPYEWYFMKTTTLWYNEKHLAKKKLKPTSTFSQ